jgi:hypothetical protein
MFNFTYLDIEYSSTKLQGKIKRYVSSIDWFNSQIDTKFKEFFPVMIPISYTPFYSIKRSS